MPDLVRDDDASLLALAVAPFLADVDVDDDERRLEPVLKLFVNRILWYPIAHGLNCLEILME